MPAWRALLVPAFFVGSALILMWDVALAGRIAQVRRAPRSFRAMTALAGLLVVPAAILAATSATILEGRAVYLVAWIWPATLALCAAQAMYATVRRLVSPLVGAPIALYDIIIAVTALVRYAGSLGNSPMDAALAMPAAEASTLGLLLGRAALTSPLALPVPILAPAFPARWRWTASLRALLALGVAAWCVVYASELPMGYVAVRSYARAAAERMRERPRGDLAVGLRLFPALADGPPPLAVRNDLALTDSLDLDAVAIVLEPAGVRLAVLDSIAHTLDELRRDSTLLVVSLAYGSDARERYPASPEAYLRERASQVDRIARRFRPDILLPAVDPYGAGADALGRVPTSWWERYLTECARRTRDVSRRIRIGVAASSFTPQDSALYSWAAANGSPVDVVGFSLFPSFDGGLSLDARLRAADRWIRTTRKDQWVFSTGGYPLAHGEESQQLAIQGVLSWATAHATVHGIIVDGAGDYDRITGLRAPGGRLRPALATLQRAIEALAETRTQ
jgi:hypothetical protein